MREGRSRLRVPHCPLLVQGQPNSAAGAAAALVPIALVVFCVYVDSAHRNGIIGWLTGLPIILLFAVMIACWGRYQRQAHSAPINSVN